MIENVVLIRNILYRCFLIGFIFVIFIVMMYFFNRDWIININANITGLSKHEVNLFILYFLGWMRMFLLFLFLIPALALHWTGHILKKS